MRNFLLRIYFVYKFIKYDFKLSQGVSLLLALKSYPCGLFRKNYLLYNLSSGCCRMYVSDFQENFFASKINKYSGIVNNKILFNLAVKGFVKMPEILGIIVNGQFIRYSDSRIFSYHDLCMFIHEKGGVIVKPIDGDGGIGIFKIVSAKDKKHLNVAGIIIANNELPEHLSKVSFSFISVLLDQHPYSKSLYDQSVNTIRVLVFKDVETRRFFIGSAAHRIGNDESKPVDNCGRGGFTASIDISTGVLGKAVRTYFKGLIPTWYSKHPDTGSQIEGSVIPEWENVKLKILELSNYFSFLEYIGWDIVVLPNNQITIIEANDACDLKLHQVHSPLLKEARIRKFYKFHKII